MTWRRRLALSIYPRVEDELLDLEYDLAIERLLVAKYKGELLTLMEQLWDTDQTLCVCGYARRIRLDGKLACVNEACERFDRVAYTEMVQ